MPGVVLVHGAWHGAWCWDGVVDELTAADVPVTAVTTPPLVAEILQGDRRRRPAADRSVAAGLRAELEDRIFELHRRGPRGGVLRIRTRDLRTESHLPEMNSAPTALLRGVLVSQLLRLVVVGQRIDSIFDDALDAWRATAPDSSLLETFGRLEPSDRARLATDVTAHAVTLIERLGPIPAKWRPRTAVAIAQHLANGRVVIRDVVDLVVGSTSAPTASVALFDLTTSPFGPSHERVLRYHALVETLRSNVAPLRVVSLSSATSEVWNVEVDHPLLRRALDELSSTMADRWNES